jgi:HSP20 family molecular chaperone IbpA
MSTTYPIMDSILPSYTGDNLDYWDGKPSINTPYIKTTQPIINTPLQANWDSIIRTFDNQNPRKNVYIDKNYNYCVDIEITGYSKDQIELSSVGQKIKIRFFKDHQEEFVGDDDNDILGNDNSYITNEIILIDNTFEMIIPEDYEVEKLIAKKYENGLLKISFPPKSMKLHQLI